MLSRKVVIFNTLSLVVTLGLAVVLFPYVVVPDEKRAAAEQPLPVEEFADVNLGPDYGEVSVAELMGYYIENPPAPASADAPQRQHFGGC